MSEAESKKIFQKKFNRLLAEQHITQKEVAAICGASTSTVSTWSKGTNMPRMDKIERLANYFSLPKSYFIEDDHQPNEFTSTLEADPFANQLFAAYGEVKKSSHRMTSTTLKCSWKWLPSANAKRKKRSRAKNECSC